jgi:hypothetical protein
LSLKSTKKNALIDFLTILAEIATTTCSKENIKHGFIEARIINRYGACQCEAKSLKT